MREKYHEQRVVSCYEADANHLMRPTAMLNIMQEAAGRDAATLGFGYEDMIKANTAWVLSRIKICFHKYPKWRDTVNLYTWHKGANRIFYLRDFLLNAPNGETLISATTSWLIIDLASRRMVRDKALAENFNNAGMGDAIAEQAEKIQLPKDAAMEFAGTHNVVWSDIDTNGHVNNVKYAVWALDAVDFNDAKNRQPLEMVINFDAEILPMSKVDIYRLRVEAEDTLTYYITGKVEGKTNFSIKMVF